MRRIAPLLLLAIAAACQDQPVAPDAAGSTLAAAKTPSDVAPISFVLTQPRLIGFTTTDDLWRYPNRPDADVGGDLVVWQYKENPYYGPVQVYQTSISTGERTQVGEVMDYAGPRTSGRYTTWQDGATALELRDNTSGMVRRITGMRPWAGSVSIAGDRLVYIDLGNFSPEAVVLYDIASGTSRTLETFWSGRPYSWVGSVDFDGRYAAYVVQAPGGGQGIVVYDTQTGEQRMAVSPGPNSISGPSLDGGRMAYARDGSVYVLDLATGATRTISSGTDPHISGNLLVWTRALPDANGSPYVFNHDVYLYDLSSGTTFPLATDPTWSSDARVDGNHVIWTEWRNNRWELLQVDAAPASVGLLRDELRRMAATGAVANAGIARSLDVFLAQAADAQAKGDRTRAAERLRQFIAMVQQHAGTLIDAASATRLEGIAAGAMARL
jgi:hypothetical protein